MSMKGPSPRLPFREMQLPWLRLWYDASPARSQQYIPVEAKETSQESPGLWKKYYMREKRAAIWFFWNFCSWEVGLVSLDLHMRLILTSKRNIRNIWTRLLKSITILAGSSYDRRPERILVSTHLTYCVIFIYFFCEKVYSIWGM